jgi:hypothetical protein
MSLLLPRVFYPEKKQIPFADAFSSDWHYIELKPVSALF